MNRSSIEKAVSLLKTRPEIAGNPRAREMLEIIQNGDAERGERVANNLLENYGVTKEQALEEARKILRF